MPYNKIAPQWNAVGTEPPQSLKDDGWQFNQKPPADYFNWFFYNTTQAIIELQLEALNTEQKGAANGLATLGADSRLTASQLPAIGSGQITDGSITNTDLATDIKVGSLATLSTTAKSTVVAAVNEVKSSADAKIPNSEKGAASGVATLGSDSKLTASQLPAIGSGQITDNSITNTDLATDVKVGSLAALKTANKASVTVAVNEIHDEFDVHNGDSTRHLTGPERLKWDGAQLFPFTADTGLPKQTVSNLNTATSPGIYSVSNNGTGAPTTAVGILIVLKRITDNIQQSYWATSGDISYTRTSTDNGITWSAWKTNETTDGAQAKVDLVQKVKLTQDNGDALAPVADANLITKPGYYRTSGTTINTPNNAINGVIIHIERDSRPNQLYFRYEDQTFYVRYKQSPGWLPWRRIVDTNLLGNVMFGNKLVDQSLANLIGKAAGSATFNPHYAGSRLAVGLGTPLQSWLEFIQSNYNSLVAIDGATITHTTSANGEQAQQRFSFNLIEHVQRTYGNIPGTTTAEKVAWLNTNLSRMAFNWWGNGSSPSGNKATVTVFLNDTGVYAGANIAHTNAGVSKLVYGFTQIVNKIDANGFIHFIAYAEPSNGTAASVINTDYAELEVELSTSIWDNVPALTELTLTLQNGATDGGRTPKMKYAGRNVQCIGTVSNTVVGTTFATLPVGYRPAQSQIFSVGGFASGTVGKTAVISIGQDGTMQPLALESGLTRIDLSSINFLV